MNDWTGKVVNVGVGCLVERGGRVLLMRRRSDHQGGTWSTPGGYLDHGESIEECAIREMSEETSVVISNPRFRAITNDVFSEDKHVVTIWMEADWVSGEPKTTNESFEVGWFDWSELPTPLFLSFKNLIESRTLS